jgi:hypothetical protein
VKRASIAFAILALLLTAAAVRGPPVLQVVAGAPTVVEVLGDPEFRDLGVRLVSDPAVWKPLPGIGTLPEVGIDSLQIWLTSDLGTGVPPGLSHPEPWVAGTADPAKARIALRTGPGLNGPRGLRSVLRHEIAHIGLGAATGGNYPRWLTEGYAQYASGEWSWEDAWHLQSAFLRRGATTLEEIDLRFRRHSTEARMGYLLSYTAVHELAAIGGEAGLAAVFRRLGEGVTFEEALRRTYGITAENFEVRWKRSLVDRYGWMYLLSRAGVFWLAVTALVLFVALRRSNRDRTRLEELRAEDLRMVEAPADEIQQGQLAELMSISSGSGAGSTGSEDGPGAD